MRNVNHHPIFKIVIASMQAAEEIGGVRDDAEYVAIMSSIRDEAARRVDAARRFRSLSRVGDDVYSVAYGGKPERVDLHDLTCRAALALGFEFQEWEDAVCSDYRFGKPDETDLARRLVKEGEHARAAEAAILSYNGEIPPRADLGAWETIRDTLARAYDGATVHETARRVLSNTMEGAV